MYVILNIYVLYFIYMYKYVVVMLRPTLWNFELNTYTYIKIFKNIVIYIINSKEGAFNLKNKKIVSPQDISQV